MSRDDEAPDRLAREVHGSLERLARELLARKSGGHLIEASLDSLELELELPLGGRQGDRRRFAEALQKQIDQRLDERVQHAAAFRPGHAYCHRCESASCRHSRPPSSRHVFVRYLPTGTPGWMDLAQLCLELKHPQVDRLYADPPAFVTLCRDRRELHGGMLRAFNRGTYELLGEVIAGFFRIQSRAEEGRGVLALTIQAAASRARGRRRRIGLNLLGRTPAGEDLSMLWERHDELPWRRGVQWAQSALASVGRGGRGGRREEDQRVLGIMQGLARRLERDQRARSRRTRHAEDRHASGRRPTRKAVDDAREVRPENCLIDQRSRTVVVLGDRGRTHFFTEEGQHVSSVRYSKDAIARKIKLEQWSPAPRDVVEAFRQRLAEA